MTRGTWESRRKTSQAERKHLLATLLKRVSRAFYLSIRVLPSGMRMPVAIAYLLARAADTIADTATVPVEERIKHLNEFRRLTLGEGEDGAPSKLSAELTDLQPTEGERALLGELQSAFGLLEVLSEADARSVRSVLTTLTDGMLFDLRTFRAESAGEITALATTEKLDRYCYLIAGCVGEFWTDISIAYNQPLSKWDAARMRAIGVRFGLALQMTNILRDVPRDLQMGRCYLPQAEIERVGLRVDDLQDPLDSRRARPLLNWGIGRTLDHYEAAEQYIFALPRRNLRLRLAALWPVLIGLGTLARLAQGNDWLDPAVRVRVPRRTVYGIIALSVVCGRSNALTSFWIRRIRRRVERALREA